MKIKAKDFQTGMTVEKLNNIVTITDVYVRSDNLVTVYGYTNSNPEPRLMYRGVSFNAEFTLLRP